MTNWTYFNGQLEARNEAGALLLVMPAEPLWAPLADFFNLEQSLSQLLLAGYGFGDNLVSPSARACHSVLGHLDAAAQGTAALAPEISRR